jgi:hypothetical protein
MASKKAKVIGGVAAVLLVGAGSAWYVVTGNILSNATSWLAQVASKKLEGGTTTTLTYDSITRSSFPSIGVRLTNPRFAISYPGTDNETKAPLVVNIALDGTVDTTTDYFANAYNVTVNGAYTYDGSVGETKFSGKSAMPTTEHWLLKAKDRATFNAWNTLDWKNEEAVKAAIKGIAAARYEIGAYALNDAKGQLQMAGDNMVFGFNNRSNEETIDGDVVIQARALEVSGGYEASLEALMQATGLPQLMELTQMPFAASRGGKQDMDIVAAIQLPMGIASGASPSGFVDVSKFYTKNNFYTLNMPMRMVLNEANGQRNLSLKLDWMLDVTAAGGAEGQYLVNAVAEPFLMAAQAAPEGQALDGEALKQRITAALPTLSTLGPITLAIDLDATSPSAPSQPGQPATGKDSVTMRNFSLTHKRWGIIAKGDSLNDTNGATINASLVCKQCDTLTGDVVSTAQSAQEVMNTTTPGRPQMALTPEFVASLNSTLAEIGSKDAAGDVTFTFTTPKPGEVAVNGKPIAEVGPKLMALFAALQPAPDAGLPEEAPAQ